MVRLLKLAVLFHAAVVFCATSGCSGDQSQELVDGDIRVIVSPERLEINRDDDVLLVLDAKDLAFRTATATFEELFGSYEILEEADEWSSTTRFSQISSDDEAAIQFELHDASGLVGTGMVAVESAGHVALELTGHAQNRARMAFDCAPTDHFNGLGAQAMDVDHRGHKVFLFSSEPGIGKQQDNEHGDVWFLVGKRNASSVPVPAVVTSRGTAWLLDTYAYADFDLCATDPDQVILEAWENTLRFHLFDGPTPLLARARMTEFVGRPPMPPEWAFAPWNDALYGSESILEFANFLRKEEIPSSAIWSEDFRGGRWESYGYRIAPNWRVDRDLYPNFEETLAELKSLGIAFQAYFNPHVIEGADVYEDVIGDDIVIQSNAGGPLLMAGADGTFGDTAVLDLTKPEAQRWAKDRLIEAMDQGVRGWMADFGEWMPVDGAVLHDGDPALVHNEYPVLWQRVNREAIIEAGLEGQVGAYFRSGHLRSQGEASIVWGGDQRTSFDADDGLPTIVPIGLGLAAVGFPFYAHDVGGYQFAGNAPTSKELFYRWTQLGALSPVMRTHHGIKSNENWDLQSDAETTAMWRDYARLHIRLYPYYRGLAQRAVDAGDPLWIPMGLLHPNDEAAWGVTDQFYFGTALMVAPVLTGADDGDAPVEDDERQRWLPASTQRDILFPEGRFVELFAGGDAVTGPTTVTLDVPIDDIPIYIRAGGLVPLTAEPAMTLLDDVDGMLDLSSTEGDRVLYVGLGGSGQFDEANGASYRLEGDGTSLEGLNLEPDGALLMTGNGSVTGADFTLSLSGHPSTRTTRVLFR